MKKSFSFACRILFLTLAALEASVVYAKTPHYQVNMRLDLKGHLPIAVSTVAKSGKKTSISEFSEDGQSETLIEFFAKKSRVNRKPGLYMDVTVTKRVRGIEKASERAQLFAPDNQELEIGSSGKRRKKASDLSLSVTAYQL